MSDIAKKFAKFFDAVKKNSCIVDLLHSFSIIEMVNILFGSIANRNIVPYNFGEKMRIFASTASGCEMREKGTGSNGFLYDFTPFVFAAVWSYVMGTAIGRAGYSDVEVKDALDKYFDVFKLTLLNQYGHIVDEGELKFVKRIGFIDKSAKLNTELYITDCLQYVETMLNITMPTGADKFIQKFMEELYKHDLVIQGVGIDGVHQSDDSVNHEGHDLNYLDPNSCSVVIFGSGFNGGLHFHIVSAGSEEKPKNEFNTTIHTGKTSWTVGRFMVPIKETHFSPDYPFNIYLNAATMKIEGVTQEISCY